jgi:hypothetical protein
MNTCDFCGELIEYPINTRCADCVNWCIQFQADCDIITAEWKKQIDEIARQLAEVDDSPDEDDRRDDYEQD